MNRTAYFLVYLVILIGLVLPACTTTSQPTALPATPVATTEPVATEAPSQPTQAPTAVLTSEPTAEPTPEPARPLVVLIDNDEGPITPANFNTFIGFWMIGWVYDPLFVRSPDLEPIPALATEAAPSADGLTWKIKLRPGVTWHDGTPFTARDVVFSYNFLIAAGRAPNLAAIDQVVADDDSSLTISLKQPAPFFLNEGLAGYYILPEHIWKDQTPVSGELNQFQGKIGTGPYMLAEVVPGESYTFKANPDYYRGAPLVAEVIAKIVKDRTQQFSQLRSQAADAVLSSVPPAFVEELESGPDIALAQGSDFFNYIFYTNGSRPPFNQVEVRQAIAKAIDVDQLVDIVLLGQGLALPLSWYHPDLPWSLNLPREYDPEGAAGMLEQAGLSDSDGDGVREFQGAPMEYEILCDVNNPVEVRATELIAGMLAEIGISASQKCLDIDTSVSFIWPDFVAIPNPDYDMAIWGWSSSVQFQRGFIRGMVDGDFGGVGWANLTGSSDEQLNDLLAEYVSNPDP
ncbi:MAG TPA: ABC transporter substrate-binding protein, partial [Anaerolineales bacterium]|nr:ABC transporter substrate-binding protein [Anaerolineales bacterium]